MNSAQDVLCLAQSILLNAVWNHHAVLSSASHHRATHSTSPGILEKIAFRLHLGTTKRPRGFTMSLSSTCSVSVQPLPPIHSKIQNPSNFKQNFNVYSCLIFSLLISMVPRSTLWLAPPPKSRLLNTTDHPRFTLRP